jgi:hypothetical protein
VGLSSEQEGRVNAILDFEERTQRAYNGIPLWNDLVDQMDNEPERVAGLINTVQAVWDGYIECLRKLGRALQKGEFSMVDEAHSDMIAIERKLYEISCEHMLYECLLGYAIMRGYAEAYVEYMDLNKQFEKHRGKDFPTGDDMRKFYSEMFDKCDNLNTKVSAYCLKEQDEKRKQWIGWGIAIVASFILGLLAMYVTRGTRMKKIRINGRPKKSVRVGFGLISTRHLNARHLGKSMISTSKKLRLRIR